MHEQAGQERVRLLKIKANLGAAVAGGPENLRVNLAKMAEGRISEDDPDFNLDQLALVIGFKQEIQGKGLQFTYSSHEDFEEIIKKHISKYLQEKYRSLGKGNE